MSAVVSKHLSVVIPVGPNDHSWRQLVNDLSVFGKELDIILAACQIQPDDMQLAENVIWIQSTQGRAQQLNLGARHAANGYIWFLHADTRLTTAVFPVVQHYLETADNHLAYFRLKFASDGPKQTRLNAWAANIRSRFFGLPFGDQGFILNKSLFDCIKGFDETVMLGEDLDFVIRLQAAKIPLQELPAELITSARRYQKQGWLITTIRHVWLTWLLTRQAKQRLDIVL